MGTAMKHPVPYRVKPSSVIFDTGADLSVRVPRRQKLQMTALTRYDTGCFIAVPVWHGRQGVNVDVTAQDESVSIVLIVSVSYSRDDRTDLVK